MTIDLLREDDSDAALALSTSEGWNQTATDWRRITRLEPSGCFAARDGRRIVGTVTTTTYGRTAAWIGMMIVHPNFRRQGIGADLMGMALRYAHGLGIASVKLDATPAGRPLYESLGFSAETEIERWQGAVGRPPREARTERCEAERLLAFDRSAFGADRSRLLEQLILECPGGPFVASSDRGALEGFALARSVRAGIYIGPVVATTAGAAERLLDGMIARLEGGELSLDLHRNGWLEPGMLETRGWSKHRHLTRMCLGPPSLAGTMRAVATSAGPQFG